MPVIIIPQKSSSSGPVASGKDTAIGCGFFIALGLVIFGGIKLTEKISDHFYFSKHKTDTVSIWPTSPTLPVKNFHGEFVYDRENDDYIKGVDKQYDVKDERHTPTEWRHFAFAKTRADTLSVIRTKGELFSDKPLFGRINENGLVLTKFTGSIKDTAAAFSASDFKEVDVIKNYHIYNY